MNLTLGSVNQPSRFLVNVEKNHNTATFPITLICDSAKRPLKRKVSSHLPRLIFILISSWKMMNTRQKQHLPTSEVCFRML